MSVQQPFEHSIDDNGADSEAIVLVGGDAGSGAGLLKAAIPYTAVDDMCVITCYFNPCRYRRLMSNYLLFKDSIESSGIKLVTVECAFGTEPFHLDSGEGIIQVRSQSVLWQKERLLNIALEKVRHRFPKIAWIDADLFFTNPDWAVEASAMLERCSLIQPFERVIQLPRDATVYNGVGTSSYGFVSAITQDPSRLKMSYDRHGRTGGAWCALSSILGAGIFDGCILGDSDHVMAHAFYGDLSSRCIDLTFYHDHGSRAYFEQWAARFIDSFDGKIGFIPETILHRWHGRTENRLYRERAEKLASFRVDPLVDLCINSDSCWEWQTERPLLHEYVANYFKSRQDDGEVISSEMLPK